MPDTLESTVVETVSSPNLSTPEVPIHSGPRDADRQALYERHYGGNPPPAEPAPVVETAAPAVQEPATPDPPVATLPPEVLELMQSMQAELTALKTQLTPATPPPADPAEPSWIALLREGKIKEAEDALADSVARRNQTQTIEQAVARAREVARAESAVETFVTNLRVQNPELIPMENMIAAEAQQLMALAQSQGKIKSTDDAIRIYQESVTEAVTSARKLYHTLRGDGKQEAMTRNREVISSRPIPPQQVDTTRPQVTGESQEPPAESDAQYLQKRQAINNWRKGLASKPDFA
jgi:hypothetical protein